MKHRLETGLKQALMLVLLVLQMLRQLAAPSDDRALGALELLLLPLLLQLLMLSGCCLTLLLRWLPWLLTDWAIHCSCCR